jgi:flagellar biogenesis protein FliO
VETSELRHAEPAAAPGDSEVQTADGIELAPLGVPGQTQRQPIGRVAKVLLGLSGVFLLVVVGAVMPKPWRRRKGHSGDELALIETVALGAGREIVIVRKKHYALVLGVTRQATHLLEKVPASSLDTDYQRVIGRIIQRESDSSEQQWRLRPLFSGTYRASYSEELSGAPVTRTSLAELRQQLQVIGPAAAPAVRRSGSPRAAATSKLQLSPGVKKASPVRRGSMSREVVKQRLREQARRAS